LKDKPLKEKEFNHAIQTYYGIAGWNEQGTPSNAKLAELGVEWAGEVIKRTPESQW